MVAAKDRPASFRGCLVIKARWLNMPADFMQGLPQSHELCLDRSNLNKAHVCASTPMADDAFKELEKFLEMSYDACTAYH